MFLCFEKSILKLTMDIYELCVQDVFHFLSLTITSYQDLFNPNGFNCFYMNEIKNIKVYDFNSLFIFLHEAEILKL